MCCGGNADKEGRPVIVVRLLRNEVVSTETKLHVILFVMERSLQLLTTDANEQLTWVLDLRQFGRAHMDFRLGIAFNNGRGA